MVRIDLAHVGAAVALHDGNHAHGARHTAKAAEGHHDLSEVAREVSVNVVSGERRHAPAKEAVGVEVVARVGLGPVDEVSLEGQVVGAGGTVVVTFVRAATGDVEVHQEVRGGQVEAVDGHVQVVVLRVGHVEVLGQLTGHRVVGRVQLRADPVRVVAVNGHRVGLEVRRDVGRTEAVGAHDGDADLGGDGCAEVLSVDVEEVGLVDHRTRWHDELGRSQVLTDGGHHRALVQLNLVDDFRGPRQVLDLADRVRDENRVLGVDVAHVVAEVRVEDVHAAMAFKVNAVHQGFTAVFEQETHTGVAAIEFSVVDQQLRVVRPNGFGDAFNGGVVGDGKGASIGFHTDFVTGDGGAAEGHRIAICRHDTRSARLAATDEVRVLVHDVTTVDEQRIGWHRNKVVGRVDARPTAVLKEDTGRADGGRREAHRNVVAADDRPGDAADRGGVVGVQGDAAVAVTV